MSTLINCPKCNSTDVDYFDGDPRKTITMGGALISVGGDRDRICLKCEHKWDSESDQLQVNPLQETLSWFQQAIPEPTEKQSIIQLGCCFEEIEELLESISGDYDDDESVNLYARSAWAEIGDLSRVLKKCLDPDFIPSELPQKPLLDALADIIVTAVGVSHMLGHDIIGALSEVNRANFSKFEDGKPVFDENGKITKGIAYIKPNLAPFIHTRTFDEQPKGGRVGWVVLN